MEEVLGVPYAGGRIGKLDLVGVPGFAAGAMENWGLITFREADLLVPPGDPEQGGASVQQLYRVPLVVAHEVAHMWFGALPAVLCVLWTGAAAGVVVGLAARALHACSGRRRHLRCAGE